MSCSEPDPPQSVSSSPFLSGLVPCHFPLFPGEFPTERTAKSGSMSGPAFPSFFFFFFLFFFLSAFFFFFPLHPDHVFLLAGLIVVSASFFYLDTHPPADPPILLHVMFFFVLILPGIVFTWKVTLLFFVLLFADVVPPLGPLSQQAFWKTVKAKPSSNPPSVLSPRSWKLRSKLFFLPRIKEPSGTNPPGVTQTVIFSFFSHFFPFR